MIVAGREDERVDITSDIERSVGISELGEVDWYS